MSTTDHTQADQLRQQVRAEERVALRRFSVGTAAYLGLMGLAWLSAPLTLAGHLLVAIYVLDQVPTPARAALRYGQPRWTGDRVPRGAGAPAPAAAAHPRRARPALTGGGRGSP